jgi:hypothetical protein
MTLGYRDPGDRVRETERTTVRRKIELPGYFEAIVTDDPVVVQGLHEFIDLLGSERLDAAFAGLAVFFGELGHDPNYTAGVGMGHTTT